MEKNHKKIKFYKTIIEDAEFKIKELENQNGVKEVDLLIVPKFDNENNEILLLRNTIIFYKNIINKSLFEIHQIKYALKEQQNLNQYDEQNDVIIVKKVGYKKK